MNALRWWLLAGMLCHGVVQAKVYRCEQDGSLSFSDRPCAAGQDPIDLAQPNTLETSAGERALAQQFDARTATLHATRLAADDPPQPVATAHKALDSRSRKSSRRASTKRPKAPKLPKLRAPAQDVAPAAQQVAPPRQQAASP